MGGEPDSGGGRGAAELNPGDGFGDYSVRAVLGKGASGIVYLVAAPDGCEYALKLVDSGRVSDGDSFRRRFVREVEFAMGIRHSNMITIHDAGENPETGVCYILMDYMPGGSLADLMKKRGPLPVTEAVSIASQVALALEAAHSRGVIHRDLKPENILFASDGTPKLADLGVAKFESDVSTTMVRSQGMIVGTPAYMAPEQMMDSHSIDSRADIYSLGVVLYEMLTNKRPNGESTVMGLLAKAVRGDPLPDVRTMRPEVSASVAYVLSVMCAPRREDRPRTSGAAADLLVRADSGTLLMEDPAASAPGGGEGRKKWWRRLFSRPEGNRPQ